MMSAWLKEVNQVSALSVGARGLASVLCGRSSPSGEVQATIKELCSDLGVSPRTFHRYAAPLKERLLLIRLGSGRWVLNLPTLAQGEKTAQTSVTPVAQTVTSGTLRHSEKSNQGEKDVQTSVTPVAQTVTSGTPNPPHTPHSSKELEQGARAHTRVYTRGERSGSRSSSGSWRYTDPNPSAVLNTREAERVTAWRAMRHVWTPQRLKDEFERVRQGVCKGSGPEMPIAKAEGLVRLFCSEELESALASLTPSTRIPFVVVRSILEGKSRPARKALDAIATRQGVQGGADARLLVEARNDFRKVREYQDKLKGTQAKNTKRNLFASVKGDI